MNTESKKFYDYVAGVAVMVLVIGMFGYQLVTAWFIVPIFLVVLFVNYKRIELLGKDKTKPALIRLAVSLLSVLFVYLIYTFWLV